MVIMCKLAAAAAASRWPRLALSEVHVTFTRARESLGFYIVLSASPTAPTSIGSPSAVPVPCASRDI